MSRPPTPADDGAARRQVAEAIQKLAAARLGRAFVPLAALVLLGVAHIAVGRGGFVLAGGAALSALAMLAYGLQVVKQAFGHRRTAAMAAAAAGLVPAAYAVWVLGWLGLRALAVASGLLPAGWALLHVALGLWLVRRWLQILELSRLAATMATALPGDGESAR